MKRPHSSTLATIISNAIDHVVDLLNSNGNTITSAPTPIVDQIPASSAMVVNQPSPDIVNQTNHPLTTITDQTLFDSMNHHVFFNLLSWELIFHKKK
ncbi:MAG: hypothetical protein JSS07_07520 [Proteobacteria bacterium]|nr:hypothetical protein [Pseudomonadota bacterium]